MTSRFIVLLPMVISLVFAGASHAIAEDRVDIGVHGSYASDRDLGVGVRADWRLKGLKGGRLGLVTSFDYFFASDTTSGPEPKYFEVNGNLTYSLGEDQPYLGFGLNVAHLSTRNVSSRDHFANEVSTDAGLNLLAGVKIGGSKLKIFAEVRVEVGGGAQSVGALGILF